MIGYETLAARARDRMQEVRTWAEKAPYEKKGILNSEILFLAVSLEGVPFRRLLESGRARGQSTLMLSLAFPDREIVSIEFDKNSPDRLVAEERLRGRTNVELLFGDARKLLPEMARDGDVVLIDGPKGFRSVRLAIELLATGRVSHVFVHDLSVDTKERAFIEANFPEAYFSDSRTYAETAHLADSNVQDILSPKRQINGFQGDFGYGYSLTALPYVPNKPYRWLLMKAWMAGLIARFNRHR
jgi:precorrin-6B methylase 2